MPSEYSTSYKAKVTSHAVWLLERAGAFMALLLVAPVLLLASFLILVESGWPVLFVQERMGLHGVPFRLFKLRTMCTATSGGPKVTSAIDPRITRVGRLFRKYKIDELPQIWNVLRGDMQVIGPRPEVRHFVNLADPIWIQVLSIKPGITDPASLLYRSEEDMLCAAKDPERFYREHILPHKLRVTAAYALQRSFRSDCSLLISTLRAVLFPQRLKAPLQESTYE